MRLLCSECYEPLYNPYLAVISAYKQRTSLEEGPGLGICSSHVYVQLGELIKRYQQHKLQNLSDGLIFLLDVAESTTNPDGTIDDAVRTRRQGIVGYLVKEEMGKYLPKTMGLISSRLEELHIFTVTG